MASSYKMSNYKQGGVVLEHKNVKNINKLCGNKP